MHPNGFMRYVGERRMPNELHTGGELGVSADCLFAHARFLRKSCRCSLLVIITSRLCAVSRGLFRLVAISPQATFLFFAHVTASADEKAKQFKEVCAQAQRIRQEVILPLLEKLKKDLDKGKKLGCSSAQSDGNIDRFSGTCHLNPYQGSLPVKITLEAIAEGANSDSSKQPTVAEWEAARKAGPKKKGVDLLDSPKPYTPIRPMTSPIFHLPRFLRFASLRITSALGTRTSLRASLSKAAKPFGFLALTILAGTSKRLAWWYGHHTPSACAPESAGCAPADQLPIDSLLSRAFCHFSRMALSWASLFLHDRCFLANSVLNRL